MSVATEALLSLASILAEMPPTHERRAALWASPVICTPDLYAEAEEAAENDAEREALAAALLGGFIVTAADPTNASALLGARVKFVNRAERRKRK